MDTHSVQVIVMILDTIAIETVRKKIKMRE